MRGRTVERIAVVAGIIGVLVLAFARPHMDTPRHTQHVGAVRG
jgi:hypothetical protein